MTTSNSFGEPVAQWTDFATVSATIEPKTSTEFSGNQQIVSNVYYRIRIRYLDGIDPTMRIVWSGHLFNITGILNPDMRKREIEILAYEAK